MSLKIKLVSAISAFVLVLSMLLVGVYAASQTINLRGEVNFNIEDTTLYVKDIRMQSEITGTPETIENFMPGYINSTLDLNLGTIESTSGVVMIEIDMINTTATDYTATSDSVLQNASLELSGTVTGSSTPIEDVATTQTISGTITLTITYTGTTTISLDNIIVVFTEVVAELGGYIVTFDLLSPNTNELAWLFENYPDALSYSVNGEEFVNFADALAEQGTTESFVVNNVNTLVINFANIANGLDYGLYMYLNGSEGVQICHSGGQSDPINITDNSIIKFETVFWGIN